MRSTAKSQNLVVVFPSFIAPENTGLVPLKKVRPAPADPLWASVQVLILADCNQQAL